MTVADGVQLIQDLARSASRNNWGRHESARMFLDYYNGMNGNERKLLDKAALDVIGKELFGWDIALDSIVEGVRLDLMQSLENQYRIHRQFWSMVLTRQLLYALNTLGSSFAAAEVKAIVLNDIANLELNEGLIAITVRADGDIFIELFLFYFLNTERDSSGKLVLLEHPATWKWLQRPCECSKPEVLIKAITELIWQNREIGRQVVQNFLKRLSEKSAQWQVPEICGKALVRAFEKLLVEAS